MDTENKRKKFDLTFTIKVDFDRMPDDARKQAKLDHIIAVMEGEGGNFSADIYISVLSAFALAVMNQGFDPIATVDRIVAASRSEITRRLKDQGISIPRKPVKGRLPLLTTPPRKGA